MEEDNNTSNTNNLGNNNSFVDDQEVSDKNEAEIEKSTSNSTNQKLENITENSEKIENTENNVIFIENNEIAESEDTNSTTKSTIKTEEHLVKENNSENNTAAEKINSIKEESIHETSNINNAISVGSEETINLKNAEVIPKRDLNIISDEEGKSVKNEDILEHSLKTEPNAEITRTAEETSVLEKKENTTYPDEKIAEISTKTSNSETTKINNLVLTETAAEITSKTEAEVSKQIFKVSDLSTPKSIDYSPPPSNVLEPIDLNIVNLESSSDLDKRARSSPNFIGDYGEAYSKEFGHRRSSSVEDLPNKVEDPEDRFGHVRYLKIIFSFFNIYFI